ncbi:hypothetical protein [Oceanirhabdus sp. W0125-5]|uniref:hypothetical protein n=1 Tax=Oceanirhabdus sp. W0125-5 TaxID=2999116 RepID=UPI0022F341B6|nr:hypothetical protein [Oceanirhabdus sp. W0125-5]WBW96368.1 hypothetical protein OW730_22130 [Oceanirhabdus sp. W0125-5]
MSLAFGLILLVLLGFVLTMFISLIPSKISGLKIMLLGITLTIFGGIIALDTNLDIGFIGYIIAFIGLIFSIVGIRRNE